MAISVKRLTSTRSLAATTIAASCAIPALGIARPLGNATPAPVPATPAPAAVRLNAAAVLDCVIHRNASLHSYRSAVTIAFRERTFPFLGARLSGNVYFESPQHYAVVFDHVPRVMRRFPHAYAGLLNVAAWPHEYTVSGSGQKVVSGHTDVVLKLAPKQRASDIDHAEAEVDPKADVIDSVDWRFRNGMEFDVTQQFARHGSLVVLSAQHATIHVPFARVTADAVFSDFQANQPIDQTVFAQT